MMFVFARSVSPPGTRARIESYCVGAKRSILPGAGFVDTAVSVCANDTWRAEKIKSMGLKMAAHFIDRPFFKW